MKTAMTTLFWVGEPDNDDNDYITNVCSYWDKDWQKNYGGVDDPKYRKGYLPAGFTPRENPFYVALPYGEFLKDGTLKRRLPTIVPWCPSGDESFEMCPAVSSNFHQPTSPKLQLKLHT